MRIPAHKATSEGLKIPFTKNYIESLPTPESGRDFYHDKTVNGLVLRVYPSGRKSFYLYRRAKGKIHNIKIGDYADYPIPKARRQAKIILGKLQDGIDVLGERRHKILTGVTLQEVLDDYIQSHDLKPSTIQDYRRGMKWAFEDWLDKPVTNIELKDVESRHIERGKRSKARANNAVRVLRALFNYAIPKYRDENKNPIIKFNAASHVAQYKIPRKSSFIKEHQFPAWFAAVSKLHSDKLPTAACTAKDLLYFLLFTGLRITEAASLRWECVDLKDKSFVLQETKNRTSPTLPLNSYTYLILANRSKVNEWVFPSAIKAEPANDIRGWIKKVCSKLDFTFSAHDLRRSFLTIGESLDISPITLKRLANHKTKDVTEGYIGHDISRLRKASQLIADKVLEYANG